MIHNACHGDVTEGFRLRKSGRAIFFLFLVERLVRLVRLVALSSLEVVSVGMVVVSEQGGRASTEFEINHIMIGSGCPKWITISDKC